MATAYPSENESIETLNNFLRGEITASETYRIAIEKLPLKSTSRRSLDAARASHLQRVRKLQAKIRELGGIPASDGGMWGSFAKTVESGAALFGEKTAVSVLETGEDQGLQRYRDEATTLAGATHAFLVRDLLPAQLESHKLMRELKRSA